MSKQREFRSLRWPKKIRAKSVSDVLLGTPDIMPTLLSMMNIPVPRSVEGKDLSRSIMYGGSGSGEPEAAHMQGMGATAAWADGSEWRGLRDEEYTYGIYRRDRKELLFHNPIDPYQMNNLAEDRSKVSLLAHYRSISESWRKEMKHSFEPCTSYQSWTVDRNIVDTTKGIKQDLQELKRITDRWFPNATGDRLVSDTPVGN